MHCVNRSLILSSVRRQQCQQAKTAQQVFSFLSTKPNFEPTSTKAGGSALHNAIPLSEVKGFKDYPFLGTVLSVMFHKKFRPDRIHAFWRAAFDEYGPVVRLRYPWSFPIVLIYRPEDIEATYKATQDNPIRYGFSSLRYIRKNAEGNFFENKTGLLPENNEEWKRVRTKVQAPTLRTQNLFKYLPMLDEVAKDFLERVQELQDQFGEMPPNFLEEIYKWAIESVSLMTLNRRFGCLEKNGDPNSTPQQMINLINETFSLLAETEVNIKYWKYFPSPKMRKLQALHNETIRMLQKAFEESKLIPERAAVVSFHDVLLRTPGLSEKDVFTFILDLYAGGVDTTSHSFAFTLYLLAKHPEVQARLQEEVDKVLGDGEEQFTEKHYKAFSYLKNVVKESLRLFPVVVGTPRILEKDTVLSGYLVPKGYGVYCVNMVTSQHEDVFPRAKEFLPERWQRDQPLGPIHPFASIPFAQGPRMCIGRRIAENELYVILARTMHRYNIEYKYEDIEIKTRLVALPSKPLRFRFKQRRKGF